MVFTILSRRFFFPIRLNHENVKTNIKTTASLYHKIQTNSFREKKHCWRKKLVVHIKAFIIVGAIDKFNENRVDSTFSLTMRSYISREELIKKKKKTDTITAVSMCSHNAIIVKQQVAPRQIFRMDKQNTHTDDQHFLLCRQCVLILWANYNYATTRFFKF